MARGAVPAACANRGGGRALTKDRDWSQGGHSSGLKMLTSLYEATGEDVADEVALV